MKVRIDNVTFDSNEHPIVIEFDDEEARCLRQLNKQESFRFAAVPPYHFPNRSHFAYWLENLDMRTDNDDP